MELIVSSPSDSFEVTIGNAIKGNIKNCGYSVWFMLMAGNHANHSGMFPLLLFIAVDSFSFSSWAFSPQKPHKTYDFVYLSHADILCNHKRQQRRGMQLQLPAFHHLAIADHFGSFVANRDRGRLWVKVSRNHVSSRLTRKEMWDAFPINSLKRQIFVWLEASPSRLMIFALRCSYSAFAGGEAREWNRLMSERAAYCQVKALGIHGSAH